MNSIRLENSLRAAILVCVGLLATHCGNEPAPKPEEPDIPKLQTQGTAEQLIVGGKPFLMLAGELHNSSASNRNYMEPIWPQLEAMNLNTVLAVISWELTEPEEGRFDFTLADALIEDARRHHQRLVILWFGSWKNGVSSYVPAWVKRDGERFPRAADSTGKGMEVLSTLSVENLDADARAYGALMRHIREVDGEAQTVIMMQVENEVGVLGDSRDRSPKADEAFAGPVPPELTGYLVANRDKLHPQLRKMWEAGGGKETGSWTEVFGSGPSADEVFMAWNYARYVNRVAQAGKSEYALPMFVNAWLSTDSRQAGFWPSGGPLPHVIDIWRAGAPQIDFLAPDIYQPNFKEWCARYTQSGNPLFIPETRGGPRGAVNVLYAMGQHDAMGFSPFAIDRDPDPAGDLAQSYEMLSHLAPLILESQGMDKMGGFVLDEEAPEGELELGGYALTARLGRNQRGPQTPVGGAIVFSRGNDEYVVAGKGLNLTFAPITPGLPIAGLESVDEGTYENGEWVPGRRLNGDETAGGKALRLPGDRFTIQRVKLYRYR